MKIGDDEAGIGSVRPSFGTRDDAFNAAPARGTVVKLPETPHLGCFGAASKRALAFASNDCTWRRKVVLGATPKMKSSPLAQQKSMNISDGH